MFSDLPTPAYHQTSFNPAQPYGSLTNQVNAAKSAYDTGFIPMQPTYEQPSRSADGGYASLNDALSQQPNGYGLHDTGVNGRDRLVRRESSQYLQQLREGAGSF